MISFLAFYLIWAKHRKWKVPDCHFVVCHWLEHREDLAVLRCFRGFGKSTILAVYNAWRYYCDVTYLILHQSESDPTAFKTSRDTQNVLRKHPLTKGMITNGNLPVEQWWVAGAMDNDSRNSSMYAKGILSNVTSARANECQNDDVEVPRNIGTPEAREKLRYRLEEQTHILIPGGRTLFIGTPHTYDSLYDEQEELGADCLTIKLFRDEHRIDGIDKENAGKRRFPVPFKPEYVFHGIHKAARILIEGIDYKLSDGFIEFAEPIDIVIDCYARCEWPERFTIEEMTKRRKKTRTLNAWDSQYQLHSKPINDSRLNPERMRAYNVEPVIQQANKEITMWLGNTQIVSCVAYWDVALGKLKSDASALSLLFTDAKGHLYWHKAQELTGDLAVFNDTDDKIIGGQVTQIRDLVIKYQIPSVTIEVNGPGGFAPKLLRQALRGTGCAVIEEFSVENKQKRILDAFEAPLSSKFLWAHIDVINGPVWGQMEDFNPVLTNQPDDFIDSGAGAILKTPVRIGKMIKNPAVARNKNWRANGGTHEVTTDYS